jgi:hypothetical protein
VNRDAQILGAWWPERLNFAPVGPNIFSVYYRFFFADNNVFQYTNTEQTAPDVRKFYR